MYHPTDCTTTRRAGHHSAYGFIYHVQGENRPHHTLTVRATNEHDANRLAQAFADDHGATRFTLVDVVNI